jgi:hypothetical protein
MSRLAILATSFAVLALGFACANADVKDADLVEEAGPPVLVPDGGAEPDAEADADLDASALRCSGDFCVVDLPNPAVHGLSDWFFAGVHVDPQIGAWAIANGDFADEGSTAHLLRYEAGGWKVVFSPTLDDGVDARNLRLTAITGDGAGKLLAVGTVRGEPTGVVLRSDGTSFTVEPVSEELRGAWYAGPSNAWIVGNGGRILRSKADGGWLSESVDGGNFGAVWGADGGDIYVGGSIFADFDDFGYLGRRRSTDAGPKWSFTTFDALQTESMGWREIFAGVAAGPGAHWFGAAPDILAHAERDGGSETWSRDAFNPKVALRGFFAQNATNVWAVGEVGRIYRFDGSSWTDARLVFNGAPLIATLVAISGTANGELFIVGDGIALHKTGTP